MADTHRRQQHQPETPQRAPSSTTYRCTPSNPQPPALAPNAAAASSTTGCRANSTSPTPNRVRDTPWLHELTLIDPLNHLRTTKRVCHSTVPMCSGGSRPSDPDQGGRCRAQVNLRLVTGAQELLSGARAQIRRAANDVGFLPAATHHPVAIGDSISTCSAAGAVRRTSEGTLRVDTTGRAA